MTSIPSRIAALFAAFATAGAISLVAAGAASAATAPAFGSPEQAGFAAAGARFRYVQAVVTLPSSPLRQVADLAGHRVAVPASRGPVVDVGRASTLRGFERALSSAGLDLSALRIIFVSGFGDVSVREMYANTNRVVLDCVCSASLKGKSGEVVVPPM